MRQDQKEPWYDSGRKVIAGLSVFGAAVFRWRTVLGLRSKSVHIVKLLTLLTSICTMARLIHHSSLASSRLFRFSVCMKLMLEFYYFQHRLLEHSWHSLTSIHTSSKVPDELVDWAANNKDNVANVAGLILDPNILTDLRSPAAVSV